MTWVLVGQVVVLVVVATVCAGYVIEQWRTGPEQRPESAPPGFPERIVGTAKGRAAVEHLREHPHADVEGCERCEAIRSDFAE